MKVENNKNNKKILSSSNLNKLVNMTNKLVRLLYFLLIIGISLGSIILLKELKIFKFVMDILKVLSPLFIGFILAWLLKPLVEKLKHKNVPNILSVIIVYLVLILIIILFFKVFIPVLYNQFNNFIEKIPSLINKISNIFNSVCSKLKVSGVDINNIKNNVLEGINEYSNKLTVKIPSNIINILMNLFSLFGTVSMGLVVGIYLSIDYDHIKNYFVNIFKGKHSKDINELINKVGEEVRKTVNGTLLVALLVLVGDTFLFSLCKLESPLLFGVFCGITDLVPFIGPYIGGAAATIVGFSQKPSIGIAVLISSTIIQLIENYILQPVVMSKAIKLHPVTIIIGLLIFGHFFGIIGMILATPILALIKVLYDFFINKINYKYI